MPLKRSKSKKAVGENISKMEREGYPHNVAVAAALESQRRAGGGRKKPTTRKG